jgi:hypothetical protein
MSSILEIYEQQAKPEPAKTMRLIDNRLPQCDFCELNATVGGKTIVGSWAYMCTVHYTLLGVGLGHDLGQVLVKETP